MIIIYYKIDDLFTENEIDTIKRFIKIDLAYEESEIDSASLCEDIIIGKYSTRERAILCICHECGHRISSKINQMFRIYTNSFLSKEAVAWHYGLILARRLSKKAELNFDFDKYNGRDLNFIRKCLGSYHSGEYDDLK